MGQNRYLYEHQINNDEERTYGSDILIDGQLNCTLNGMLNDFKDDLVYFFGAEKVDQNKWENARGRLIDEVSALTYAPFTDSDVDLFELLYLPAFDHIFEMLDIENFQR